MKEDVQVQMKLSQPKSARIINRCRILCELRKNKNISKSDLSRILELNKVSTGEIVETLISSGVVKQTGKMEVSNGRRPVSLELVKDSRFVLCVDIGSRVINVALCNLVGEPVKLERMPCNTAVTVEEFCAGIIKSCMRILNLVNRDSVLGVGITLAGRISIDEKTMISCPYLPWTNVCLADVFKKTLNFEAFLCNSAVALVAAERIVNPKVLVSSQPVLYLDWGDHISLAIVSGGKVVGTNPDFGNLQVHGNVKLQDVCASWAIASSNKEKLRNLWDEISEDALETMVKALNIAYQVTGADRVVFGGESASVDMSSLCRMRRVCSFITLEKSALGDKANVLASAEFALDRFFYQTSVLEQMKEWI